MINKEENNSSENNNAEEIELAQGVTDKTSKIDDDQFGIKSSRY